MSRAYWSSQRLEELAHDLTKREWAILETLATVRLATSRQLERLHCTGPDEVGLRHCRRVLRSLVERGVLGRLERRIGGVRAGSAGYVYVLDLAGQRLLDRLAPVGNHGSRTRRPWTPGRPFLRHTLAVTEVFVRLHEAQRRGELDLLAYATEPDCWRSFIGRGGVRSRLKPDAFTRTGSGEYEDTWFLEVDRATEATTTLRRKLDVYVSYWRSGREQARRGVFPKVLWLVPNEHRKAVLVDTLVPLPEDTWPLFQVALFDQGVEVMAGRLL